MLHPEILEKLPERADVRFRAMQAAAHTALQAKRYARDRIANLKTSLELDPLDPQERKNLILAMSQQEKLAGERHAHLQGRLTRLREWSNAIVKTAIRKGTQLPPINLAEVDDAGDNPAAWLGVHVGKAEPRKSRQQLRAERERDLARRPDEHPLSYRDRMARLNGPRPPRVRVGVHPGEQFIAGLQSAMKANSA